MVHDLVYAQIYAANQELLALSGTRACRIAYKAGIFIFQLFELS